MPETEVTEEQAEAALQQLVDVDGSGYAEPEGQPVPEEPLAEAEPVVEATEETQEVAEVAPDDLESLQQRLVEMETNAERQQTNFDARLQALQHRNNESEQILREKHLRKSTVADNALKVLQSTRSADGASEADVDRAISELSGTMNPASPSYVAPPAQNNQPGLEDQRLDVNRFLTEKGMTLEDEEKFGTWVQNEGAKTMTPSQQALAGASIPAFLHVAHSLWERDDRQKAKETEEVRSDAVGAVKSVQRTQRQAARAATPSGGAPIKQPAGSKGGGLDVSKLTPDDISELVRQSVTQYK